MQKKKIDKILGYNIIGQIREGGFGTVQLAIDSKGDLYAVKRIKIMEKQGKEQADGKEQKIKEFIQDKIDKCFQRQGFQAIQFQHKNLLTPIAGTYLEEKKQVVFIMEYCEGGDLRKFIEDKKQISQTQCLNILIQIADGIAYLHIQKNIAHLDIKPDNILMKKDVVKIADFGLSKDAKISESITSQGTEQYLAPQMIAVNPSDYKPVDIWALGLTFIEIVQMKHIKYLISGTAAKNIKFPTDKFLEQNIQKIQLRALIKEMLKRDPSQRITIDKIQQRLKNYKKEKQQQQINNPIQTKLRKSDKLSSINQNKRENNLCSQQSVSIQDKNQIKVQGYKTDTFTNNNNRVNKTYSQPHINFYYKSIQPQRFNQSLKTSVVQNINSATQSYQESPHKNNNDVNNSFSQQNINAQNINFTPRNRIQSLNNERFEFNHSIHKQNQFSPSKRSISPKINNTNNIPKTFYTIQNINNGIQSLYFYESLKMTDVTDNNLFHLFQKTFDELKIIDLSGNQISDYGFQAIVSKSQMFQNLQQLNLSDNKISDKGLKCIYCCSNVQFPSLKVINLSNNKIQDQGISTFTKNNFAFPNLQQIDLDNNRISDKGIQKSARMGIFTKKKLINLQVIKLRSNRISDAGFVAFIKNVDKLPHLRQIYLNDNPIIYIGCFVELIKNSGKFPSFQFLEFRDRQMSISELSRYVQFCQTQYEQSQKTYRNNAKDISWNAWLDNQQSYGQQYQYGQQPVISFQKTPLYQQKYPIVIWRK